MFQAPTEQTVLYQRLLEFYKAQVVEEGRGDPEHRAHVRTRRQIAYLHELAEHGKHGLRRSARTAARRNRDLWAAGIGPIDWPPQLALLAEGLNVHGKDQLMHLVIGINGSKVRSTEAAQRVFGWLVSETADRLATGIGG